MAGKIQHRVVSTHAEPNETGECVAAKREVCDPRAHDGEGITITMEASDGQVRRTNKSHGFTETSGWKPPA